MKQSADSLEDDYSLAKPKKVQKKAEVSKKYLAPIVAGCSSASEMQAFWNEQCKKSQPKLSAIELKDCELPENVFVSGIAHDAQNLSSFEPFLDSVFPIQNFKRTLSNGAPLVLVLTSSAIRAVDVIRYIPNLKGEMKIAKLFAKHKKIQDQKTFLSSTPAHLAIGTPGRVLSLVQQKILCIDQLQLIIVDLSRDVKERNIMDMPEIAVDLFRLINGELLEKFKAGELKIAFY